MPLCGAAVCAVGGHSVVETLSALLNGDLTLLPGTRSVPIDVA